MKRIALVILALLLALSTGCSTQKPQDNSEIHGYESAKACAQAVADALISLDTDKLISCFAISEVASGYDLQAYIARAHMVRPGDMLVSTADALGVQYNEARLTHELLRRVVTTGILMSNKDRGDDAVQLFTTISASDADDEALLADIAWSDHYKELTYQGLVDIKEIIPDQYDALVGFEKQNYAEYGHAAWEDWALSFDWQGEQLYMPLAFAQFDGRWLAGPFPAVTATYMNISYSCFFGQIAEQ
jgi:hypothetical protein